MFLIWFGLSTILFLNISYYMRALKRLKNKGGDEHFKKQLREYITLELIANIFPVFMIIMGLFMEFNN